MYNLSVFRQNLLDYLQEIKKDENQRIKGYFEYIRRIIDKREEILKIQLNSSIGILEKRLNIDLRILYTKIEDLNSFHLDLKMFETQSKNSIPLSIVSASKKIYEIIRKVKCYDMLKNFENIDKVSDNYNQIPDEERIGDHLYMVQIDSVIPLPYFDLNLSFEIERLKKLGVI